MDTNSSPAYHLKALLLLHRTLLAGMIMIAAITYYMVHTVHFTSALAAQEKTLQIMAIVFAFAGVYAGNHLFRKRIKEIADEPHLPLNDKFIKYRAANIILWALIDAPALFAVLCYLLTDNLAILIFAASLMLVFTMTSPSKQKTILHLQLNEQEAELL